MIKVKCDGNIYTGDVKCQNERDIDSMDDLLKEPPLGWIFINGKIKSNHRDSHVIEGNGMKHFCSKECLNAYFFKQVPEKK